MNMRRFFLLIALIGLTILVLSNLGLFPQFISTLKTAHWYLIPLIIATQIVSYYAVVKYYDTFFKFSGHKVSFWKLVELSLAINFSNQAVPASSIATTAYLGRVLKGDVPPGKTTLAQLGRYVFFVGTAMPLLIIGMLIVFFTGPVSRISVRLILFSTCVIIFGGAFLISYFSERSRMRKLVNPVIRAYNSTGRFFLRGHFKPLTAVEVGEFFDEFYSGYSSILKTKRAWFDLGKWATLGNIAEMSTIYVTFIGFGHWINVGIVILAYMIAIAASLLGPLTAGAGALEFGMIGGFTALGLPFTLSFAVVIVYRFLNMALFLPPGFYFYRKDLS